MYIEVKITWEFFESLLITFFGSNYDYSFITTKHFEKNLFSRKGYKNA